jgi:hypothetical protein
MAHRTIHVGNVESQVGEDALTSFFSSMGRITNIKLAGLVWTIVIIDHVEIQIIQLVLLLLNSKTKITHMRLLNCRAQNLQENLSRLVSCVYNLTNRSQWQKNQLLQHQPHDHFTYVFQNTLNSHKTRTLLLTQLQERFMYQE